MIELTIYLILLYVVYKYINKFSIHNNSQKPTIISNSHNSHNLHNSHNFHHLYNLQKNTNEEGGMRPFKYFFINDKNLTANQVNYNKYQSYRRKPIRHK